MIDSNDADQKNGLEIHRVPTANSFAWTFAGAPNACFGSWSSDLEALLIELSVFRARINQLRLLIIAAWIIGNVGACYERLSSISLVFVGCGVRPIID